MSRDPAQASTAFPWSATCMYPPTLLHSPDASRMILRCSSSLPINARQNIVAIEASSPAVNTSRAAHIFSFAFLVRGGAGRDRGSSPRLGNRAEWVGDDAGYGEEGMVQVEVGGVMILCEERRRQVQRIRNISHTVSSGVRARFASRRSDWCSDI